MSTPLPSTETVWRERVRAWRESGLSAAAFVQGRGFAESSLRAWAARLRQSDAASPPTFVQLVPPARPTPLPAPAPTLLVEVGPARIRVPADFDADLLARVVRALESNST